MKQVTYSSISRSHQERSHNFTLIDLHDLEGAVGGVEELELSDGALRNRAEGGATPAPLDQTDGLCCKHTTRKMTN